MRHDLLNLRGRGRRRMKRGGRVSTVHRVIRRWASDRRWASGRFLAFEDEKGVERFAGSRLPIMQDGGSDGHALLSATHPQEIVHVTENVQRGLNVESGGGGGERRVMDRGTIIRQTIDRSSVSND